MGVMLAALLNVQVHMYVFYQALLQPQMHCFLSWINVFIKQISSLRGAPFCCVCVLQAAQILLQVARLSLKIPEHRRSLPEPVCCACVRAGDTGGTQAWRDVGQGQQ